MTTFETWNEEGWTTGELILVWTCQLVGATQSTFFARRTMKEESYKEGLSCLMYFILNEIYRMNYGEYMRRQTKLQSRLIGFQNGQDASQVTLKAQALSASVERAVPVETSFSKPGGSIANILEKNQSTAYETNCNSSPSGGARGVANAIQNVDTASPLIAAQHCAVCSDAKSSEPYSILIKLPLTEVFDANGNSLGLQQLACGTYTDYVYNKPSTVKCCSNDPSQLYRNNSELIANQGRQETLRKQYNLPSKLQGLRGPIVTNR